MSQMERRDGRGHHIPPLAQQKCWPHLWMHYRGYWTICQMVIGKHNHWYNMEWGCKACSCQAGHATSSTPTQGVGSTMLSFTPWSQFKAFSTLIGNRGIGAIFRCVCRLFQCGSFDLSIVLSSWSNLILLLFKWHQIYLLFFFSFKYKPHM